MRFSLLAITMLILSLVAPPSPALAQDAGTVAPYLEQRAVHDRAVDAFRARRCAAACGSFVELADAGQVPVPSARLALVKLHNGSVQFGTDWNASLDPQRRWNALVIGGGRHHTPMVGRADRE